MAQPFLPQPPRAGAGGQLDARALVDWSWRFFQALAIDNEVLIRANEFADPGTFDPASLPDPTDTTVAKAQNTGNAAWLLARAISDGIRTGAVTVAGAAASAAVPFTSAYPDAAYRIVLTRTASAGAPAAAADDVTAVIKTKTGFTVTVAAAPGVGSAVTFDYIAIR
jgi:hypothetical protein